MAGNDYSFVIHKCRFLTQFQGHKKKRNKNSSAHLVKSSQVISVIFSLLPSMLLWLNWNDADADDTFNSRKHKHRNQSIFVWNIFLVWPGQEVLVGFIEWCAVVTESTSLWCFFFVFNSNYVVNFSMLMLMFVFLNRQFWFLIYVQSGTLVATLLSLVLFWKLEFN